MEEATAFTSAILQKMGPAIPLRGLLTAQIGNSGTISPVTEEGLPVFRSGWGNSHMAPDRIAVTNAVAPCLSWVQDGCWHRPGLERKLGALRPWAHTGVELWLRV